jgi:hypothetical protein
MENAFGILAGIALIVTIVGVLDWWASRKDGKSRKRAA